MYDVCLLQWLINVKLVSIGQQNKVKHILQMQMQYLPETARCIEKCLLKGVSRNSFFISLKILDSIFYILSHLYHIWVICLYKRKDDGHENTERSNVRQIYNIIFVILMWWLLLLLCNCLVPWYLSYLVLCSQL